MLAGTAVAFGLFGLLLGHREARLLETNRRLEELAVTDALTGLRNARYFHTRLAEEHAETERTGRPLAVVVIDLDHFKRANDRYGHPVGDDVLVHTARAIASSESASDTPSGFSPRRVPTRGHEREGPPGRLSTCTPVA